MFFRKQPISLDHGGHDLAKPIFAWYPTDNLQRTTANFLFNFPVIDVLIFVLTPGHAVCAIGDDVKISIETG